MPTLTRLVRCGDLHHHWRGGIGWREDAVGVNVDVVCRCPPLSGCIIFCVYDVVVVVCVWQCRGSLFYYEGVWLRVGFGRTQGFFLLSGGAGGSRRGGTDGQTRRTSTRKMAGKHPLKIQRQMKHNKKREKKVVNRIIIIRVDRSTITIKPPLPITPPPSNKS